MAAMIPQSVQWLGCGLDDPGFNSQQQQEILLSYHTSRLALETSEPPLHWKEGVKWPRREVDHLLTSSTEVKNKWRCTATSHTCLHRVQQNNILSLSILNVIHMYICMYVWMYVCMYICMHACTYVRVCVCVCHHLKIHQQGQNTTQCQNWQWAKLADRL
jgi:hypothetical protein